MFNCDPSGEFPRKASLLYQNTYFDPSNVQITRLQTMHNREVLHRDVQLGNCAIGLTPEHETIYMIDFGFSKRYIDTHTRRHIPDSKQKRDFLGNYWFTSVNVHCKGKGQYSRLLYMLRLPMKLSQCRLGGMTLKLRR